MMIYFGPPAGHSDDPIRAAGAALAIRDIITGARTEGQTPLKCKLGLSCGTAFAAEIGDPRGRREFNVLSDTVNTAARLMGKAAANQILLTNPVYDRIAQHFDCISLGSAALKGKGAPVALFALQRQKTHHSS